MKDFEIDNYLEEVAVAVEGLGGHVNLIGLCQSGWASAMIAARFPGENAYGGACGMADGPARAMDTPETARHRS
jgi:hypothetical protein